MSLLNDETTPIQERINGRKMGAELFGLIEGDTASPRYMESLLEEIKKLAGIVEPVPAEQKHEPIARLGAHVLYYGEFNGQCLDNIPVPRLDWYLRKAEETVKAIGGYMRHPEFEIRRAAEIGEPI